MVDRWTINIGVKDEEKERILKIYENEGLFIGARALKLIRADVKKLGENSGK